MIIIVKTKVIFWVSDQNNRLKMYKKYLEKVHYSGIKYISNIWGKI